MSSDSKVKTLGQAIDEIIDALAGLNEKDREVAIHTSCLHFSLPTSRSGMGEVAALSSAIDRQTLSVSSSMNTQLHNDIRSLKEEKVPSSDHEMACIVAYYLQYLAPTEEHQETISTPDLRKYFMQAKYPLPKAIHQTLKNAQSAGYFDSPSRGQFQLNPVGYNLVVHGLPRTDATTNTANTKLRSKRKKKIINKNKTRRKTKR